MDVHVPRQDRVDGVASEVLQLLVQIFYGVDLAPRRAPVLEAEQQWATAGMNDMP